LVSERNITTRANFKTNTQSLAELWVLADRLLIPALQNQTIRELESMRKEHRISPTTCVLYIYKNTSPGSLLRRWILTVCAFNVPQDWLIENPDQFPKKMLLELATLLVSIFPAKAQADAIAAQGSFEVSEE
jgi:hypothetical protein